DRASAPPSARPAPPPRPAAKPAPPPPPAPPPKTKPVLIPLGPMPRAATQASAKPAPTAKEALAAKAKAAQAKGKPSTPPKAEAPEKREATFGEASLKATWEDAKNEVKRAGEHASALVDAWLETSNSAAIAAIAEAEDVFGAARKAARRALGVLK